jgi:hypothetical protein
LPGTCQPIRSHAIENDPAWDRSAALTCSKEPSLSVFVIRHRGVLC